MHAQWPRLATLGAAAVIFAAVSACSSPAPLSDLHIVTSDTPTLSGMEALFRATLVASPDGCVQAQTESTPVTLVWPQGYTVDGDADSFDVLDADGNIVAHSGVALELSGGAAQPFGDNWTQPDCANDDIWMVGEIN